MKIKRVEPIAVTIPMKKPVFMAGVEIRTADNVLVRIEADNGTFGWGEAASAPTMTGETVESMMAAVAYLAPAAEGRPAEDIAGTIAAMRERMYANTSAKAAIEMALHDLVGRATGEPACARRWRKGRRNLCGQSRQADAQGSVHVVERYLRAYSRLHEGQQPEGRDNLLGRIRQRSG